MNPRIDNFDYSDLIYRTVGVCRGMTLAETGRLYPYGDPIVFTATAANYGAGLAFDYTVVLSNSKTRELLFQTCRRVGMKIDIESNCGGLGGDAVIVEAAVQFKGITFRRSGYEESFPALEAVLDALKHISPNWIR